MKKIFSVMKRFYVLLSFCLGTFLLSDVMRYTAYGTVNPNTGDDSHRRMIMMCIAVVLAIIIIAILLIFKRKK